MRADTVKMKFSTQNKTRFSADILRSKTRTFLSQSRCSTLKMNEVEFRQRVRQKLGAQKVAIINYVFGSLVFLVFGIFFLFLLIKKVLYHEGVIEFFQLIPFFLTILFGVTFGLRMILINKERYHVVSIETSKTDEEIEKLFDQVLDSGIYELSAHDEFNHIEAYTSRNVWTRFPIDIAFKVDQENLLYTVNQRNSRVRMGITFSFGALDKFKKNWKMNSEKN